MLPNGCRLRIAPRTLLSASAWRVGGSGAETGFDELRELCAAEGDKWSLAVAMTGSVMTHFTNAHYREASLLASEHTRLLDSIGDPTLTLGLSFAALAAKFQSSEMEEMLRLAERAIDLADGHHEGDSICGSPLAVALTMRGNARWCLGIPGGKTDLRRAIAMARAVDATTLAAVVFDVYVTAIPYGALRSDEMALRDTAETLAGPPSGRETTSGSVLRELLEVSR